MTSGASAGIGLTHLFGCVVDPARQLSVAAARQPDLPADEVYERTNAKPGPSKNWMT
jgi:hypothetical protein